MRRQDKKKHMEESNKIFQDRLSGKIKPNQLEEDTYVYTKDIFPELSKILKYS